MVKQHRSIPPAKQEILLEGNVICQRSSFINISVFVTDKIQKCFGSTSEEGGTKPMLEHLIQPQNNANCIDVFGQVPLYHNKG